MLEECPVVIVTHNRSGALRESLERLYDLPERPPLLVVDNASTEDTERVCKPFGSRVRFLKLRKNIGAAARTMGAREAETPYVAFCDDDCAWTPGSLARAVKRFERHGEVAVLNGRVLVGESESPDPACQAMRAGRAIEGVPGVPIVYFMAGACVMRRAPFLEAGGYHVRYFIGAEESLLALDLAARGWQIWYCDDLVIRHYPSPINRDPESRRRLIMRNRLWTVLLRRSAASVVRTLARYTRMAWHDPIARTALREAIAGIPWVLQERKRIPPELERRAHAVDNRLTL
jgi:GT2 family glycosyltransferase